ncbi:hypothetical protein A8C32_00170 [Flavivirga aquatica]|uniref:Bacterial spore germination immunoglobulin-like domain-containing protein n=1 Tax=Flavivirga aquatica TaxID=1849968 RepID=A0A1E5TBI4_9FLAO|nr:hypothetical protein [Flavivirga aquatica]OEK08731.1 hypothetical protein A8C32_00170 [Flavivirga aquatica]
MKKINLKTTLTVFSLGLIFISCKDNSNSKSTDSLKLPTKEKVVTEMEIEKLKLPTVNIQENDKLISPTKIEINSQGVWLASEGTLGFVQLIDEKGTELASGILTTKENWMTKEPVMFSTELIFDSKNNTKGMLIINNDPGSGDGEEVGKKISFKIPVSF